jgi:hypothetical protein
MAAHSGHSPENLVGLSPPTEGLPDAMTSAPLLDDLAKSWRVHLRAENKAQRIVLGVSG